MNSTDRWQRHINKICMQKNICQHGEGQKHMKPLQTSSHRKVGNFKLMKSYFEDITCVIMFGSMKSGKRKTANNERDVNARAGVKSPPSKVNIPNETTITTTGILFSIKLFNCKI